MQGRLVALVVALGPLPVLAQELPPSLSIQKSLSSQPARELIAEVRERLPLSAQFEARSRESRHRADAARPLPDPQLSLTAFAMPPETRVGPQLATLSFMQKIPWSGKRSAASAVHSERAASTDAMAEQARLQAVTRARVLLRELSFQDELGRILTTDRKTLIHFEELARSRYASGVGLDQAVIKLQAEITRVEARLLEVDGRRASLRADLNALRRQPADADIPPMALEVEPQALPPLELLLATARERRPELVALGHQGEQARLAQRLADLARRPDVSVGLGYTLVGTRDDPAGRAMPPPDDGDDIIGLTASINLPLRRQRLDADRAAAAEAEVAVEAERRRFLADLDALLGDLLQQIPLIEERLELLDVLHSQAVASLDSAESGYAAGATSALDLLDAERMLLDVRTNLARSRTDLAIGLARLEGAVGAPLSEVTR